MFSEIMFMIYVLSSMLESCMLGFILVMINLVRNLNLQLSIFPTIQKPYYRQSVDFIMAGFADALRQDCADFIRSVSSLLCCMHGKRDLVFQ